MDDTSVEITDRVADLLSIAVQLIRNETSVTYSSFFQNKRIIEDCKKIEQFFS